MTRVVRLLLALILGAIASAPVAVSSATVADDAAARPLRFVLDRPLHEGGKTRVRLRNRGDVGYIYNPYYEACDMIYLELPSRREFLVPEGTHCDMVVDEEVAPGETVTLFRWDLDECIEDNWGCMKARDLKPGRYLMRGWFRPKGGGDEVRVTERFRIRKV